MKASYLGNLAIAQSNKMSWEWSLLEKIVRNVAPMSPSPVGAKIWKIYQYYRDLTILKFYVKSSPEYSQYFERTCSFKGSLFPEHLSLLGLTRGLLGTWGLSTAQKLSLVLPEHRLTSSGAPENVSRDRRRSLGGLMSAGKLESPADFPGTEEVCASECHEHDSSDLGEKSPLLQCNRKWKWTGSSSLPDISDPRKQTHQEVSPPISVENIIGVLLERALTLQMPLDSVNLLGGLILPSHKHGLCFLYLLFYSFIVFTVEKSHILDLVYF